jgi:amidohydrolase
MAVTFLDQDDLLTGLRRELHAAPEIGLDLPRTQQTVLDALAGLPLTVARGTDTTSVVAVLHGARPGPAVLLRADMDALPVEEQTDLAFASTNGAMHACGHDLHTAMLVGAAHTLAANRDQISGDVVLMFQPGEEGHHGAQVMLDEGVMRATDAPPVAAYALHVLAAALPAGAFATRPGPLLAAADTLSCTIRGAGGHGSTPHRARDPIVVLAEIVTQLQVLVTRRFDVHDPVVVTVGRVTGGTAHNVIPETASLEATLRSFSERSRRELIDAAVELCAGLARAHGLTADVAVGDVFPATINNETEARHSLEIARLLDPHTSELPAPLAGSEDFSLVLQLVPGAMTFLGACPDGADPDTAPFNHSPLAVFDEKVLRQGANFYASVAVARLARGDAA